MERKLILLAMLALAACKGSDPAPPVPDAGPTASDAGIEEPPMSPRIYQLFVRTFGNTNTANHYDADIDTNGCGKFDDINDAALDSLSKLGVTHLWLTGVFRQATLTNNLLAGPDFQPDDPDIVKGRAGSPFAIRDYFDVSPDYANDPMHGLDEFQALIGRIHAHGMKVIIDLVPNHVSRAYHSTIKPELDFGANDDKTQFFTPNNNFFYLVDPPGQALVLSYPQGAPNRTTPVIDHAFLPENGSTPARVPRATGNNVTSNRPSADDWYDVVKLNYGYNFVDHTTHYDPIPDTWTKMDAVVAYWQGLGVDGFRCDFAHWIPVEFWKWLIDRAHARGPAYFFAEAYDDPNSPPGYSPEAMVEAGFDALYDYQLYNTVKGIFAGPNWANDLDAQLPSVAMSGHMLRYAENHDERRVASAIVPDDAANSGFGSAQAGFAVTALLQLIGTDPVMIFNGQEVGDDGIDSQGFPEGFGGNDGRTTIYDYWSMLPVARWANGHLYDGAQLTDAEKSLRDQYAALWKLRHERAIAVGEFFGLQTLNNVAPEYGELGHWVYSYLRVDPDQGQSFLVLVNLNPNASYTPSVKVSSEAITRARLPNDTSMIKLTDRLGGDASVQVTGNNLINVGVQLELAPASVRVLELSAVK